MSSVFIGIRFNGVQQITASPHTLGGASHLADTLANLNLKISDTDLIATTDPRLSDARAPTAHSHAASDITAGTFDPGSFSFAGSTIDALDALTVDNLSLNANTITTTSGDLILDATGAVNIKKFIRLDGTGPSDKDFIFDRVDTSTIQGFRFREGGAERITVQQAIGSQDMVVSNSSSTANWIFKMLGTVEVACKIATNVGFRVKAPSGVSADVAQITNSTGTVQTRWDSGFNFDITGHYMEYDEISAPADPASGSTRVFMDSATGELSVRKSSSTTVSLEAAAGAAAPATFRNASEGESTTTLTTPQQKVRLTFTAVLDDYLVSWAAECKISVASQSCVTRADEDDTTEINETFNNGSTDYMTVGGWKIIAFSAASHDIDIDFRTTQATATASIRRARITAKKVAAG